MIIKLALRHHNLMNLSRSLRQPQYNTNTNVNTNQSIGISLGAKNPYDVSKRPVLDLEYEYGTGFGPSALAAPQAHPIPEPVTQNRLTFGISASLSMDRQPTLFTKDASPQRKAAELNNVLGNPSGRLDSKARVISSHVGKSKRSNSAPSSPVVFLEQAKPRARVELDLFLDSGSCVEGGYIKGKVILNIRVANKKEGPLYLGEGKVRVVGFEAIPQNEARYTFYHCGAPFNKVSPFCHMLYTSPPDDEGFCRAREEDQSIPFAMRLPQRRSEFPVAKGVYNSRVNGSSIRYIAMFSIKVKDSRTNAKSIAHCYRTIEVWPLFEPAVILAPAPTPIYASTSKALFLGGTGTVKLTGSLHRSTWVAGQRCYVRIFVANDTERRIVQTLFLTLIRAETIFKPDADVAAMSPNGTRIDGDLDACRTSTFKRVVAKSVLEMGEKVTARHATAKGWWTGVEPGTSQEFHHFILLPPFALTIPRSRLIEVSFTLEIGVSTGPLSSDISVQLPIQIINHISIDPPTAFGPPEKLRNLPPSPGTVPIINEPPLSNPATHCPQSLHELDSDLSTLARPRPSYIYTESGTYRGDGLMPPLGQLEVRNRGSTASGTMYGESSSGISHPVPWTRELEQNPSMELESALEESNNGHVEPERSRLGDGWVSLLQAETTAFGNDTSPRKDRSETFSIDEYLQGPPPVENVQEPLLSISPDQALRENSSLDEEMDNAMRSMVSSPADRKGSEHDQMEGSEMDDEEKNGEDDEDDGSKDRRDHFSASSYQDSTEASTMFSSRATSHMEYDGSEPGVASSREPSLLKDKQETSTFGNMTHSQLHRNSRSPPPRNRFLPQRPRPLPTIASRVGVLTASVPHVTAHRTKGTTLRNSLDMSKSRGVAVPSRQNAYTARPNQRDVLPVDKPALQAKRSPLLAEPKHAYGGSSAATKDIPTSISALMLQNLKTPVQVAPSFFDAEPEAANEPEERGSTENRAMYSQTLGPSDRMVTPGAGSLIKSRIAMFEQSASNTGRSHARTFKTTRSAERVHINGMRL